MEMRWRSWRAICLATKTTRLGSCTTRCADIRQQLRNIDTLLYAELCVRFRNVSWYGRELWELEMHGAQRNENHLARKGSRAVLKFRMYVSAFFFKHS